MCGAMGLVLDDPAMGIELLPDSGHSQGHPSDGLGPERGKVTQADDSGSHRPPTRHIPTNETS